MPDRWNHANDDRTEHVQQLTQADGHPIAVDRVVFVNMLDDVRFCLTIQDFEQTGRRTYRLETQLLDIPDRSTWMLQTEGTLDLS